MVASVDWATGHPLAGRPVIETGRRKVVKTFIVIVIATICAAVGETFLSFGMRRIGLANPSLWQWFSMVATNTWVLVGVFCLGGFFFLYLAALSWADLSYVMPLTALSYLFAAVLARFFLREEISWIRWAGIVVIVVGIALVALDHNEQKTVDSAPGQNQGPQEENFGGALKD